MSQAGIMNRPNVTVVDVRDMLCAQALAVVSRAMAQLDTAGVLDVRFSAEDVKHDLLVWATDRHYDARETGANLLQFRRQR